MLKINFFHKTLIPRNLLKETNIQARSMLNLKCGTYWACEVLNGSYRPSKMDEHTSYLSVTQSRCECKNFQVRGIFSYIERERDPCAVLNTV